MEYNLLIFDFFFINFSPIAFPIKLWKFEQFDINIGTKSSPFDFCILNLIIPNKFRVIKYRIFRLI